MSNSEMLALLIGALLPFVLSIVIRSGWSNQTKSILAFASCVPAGLAAAYVNGVLSLGNSHEVTADVLIVMTAAYALYEGFYKHQADVLAGIKLPFTLQLPVALRPSAPALPADLIAEVADMAAPALAAPADPAVKEAKTVL